MEWKWKDLWSEIFLCSPASRVLVIAYHPRLTLLGRQERQFWGWQRKERWDWLFPVVGAGCSVYYAPSRSRRLGHL